MNKQNPIRAHRATEICYFSDRLLGDAEPWWQAGHPSAMLSGWWSDPVHHTGADTLRLVNPNYLKIWSDILAAATYRLATGELPNGN